MPGRIRRHQFDKIENNSSLSTFARDRLNKSSLNNYSEEVTIPTSEMMEVKVMSQEQTIAEPEKIK